MKQGATLLVALALVLVQPVEALEAFVMFGGCSTGTTQTVCDAGDRGIFHFGLAHRWKLTGNWSVQMRYDHFSHYDPGELDPSSDNFLMENTGFIDAVTAGVVYVW